MNIISRRPVILIKGDTITKAQAKEVILMTADWDTLSHHVSEDLAPSIELLNEYYSLHELSLKGLHIFNNNPLDNHARWCSLQGTLSGSYLSPVDYPSMDEIFSELSTIASKFPYLSMKVQICDDGMVLATFLVKDGSVESISQDDMIWDSTMVHNDVIGLKTLYDIIREYWDFEPIVKSRECYRLEQSGNKSSLGTKGFLDITGKFYSDDAFKLLSF